MSASDVRGFYSLLMLFPFALVVGTAAFFILCAWRWARRRSPAHDGLEEIFSAERPHFSPPLFEQPSRWLAVKGNDISQVQAALGLHDPAPCSVEEGLMEARDHKIFISPPISGWILVLGSGLPDPTDDVDECFHFLRELSSRLGQVQYFSANRVVNHHAWALVDRGQVFRAYAWAGETLWNQGQTTAAEKDLRLRCHAYAADRTGYTHKNSLVPNSEKVTRLAARWSIDPTTIPDRAWNARRGIVGSFSQSKPH